MSDIHTYEDDYDEYLHDLDEKNFDSQYKCTTCGMTLIKGKEVVEVWGSEFTINEYYCPNCG